MAFFRGTTLLPLADRTLCGLPTMIELWNRAKSLWKFPLSAAPPAVLIRVNSPWEVLLLNVNSLPNRHNRNSWKYL